MVILVKLLAFVYYMKSPVSIHGILVYHFVNYYGVLI